MFGLIELGPSALTEVEMYARGLFDESKVNRDESGEFAKKSGPSAKMADEPFALGGAPKHGKGAKSHDKQASLFDKDLHGAEARDLPGQTNFLGDDDRSGIDKSDSPSRRNSQEPTGADERSKRGASQLERAKMNRTPPEALADTLFEHHASDVPSHIKDPAIAAEYIVAAADDAETGGFKHKRLSSGQYAQLVKTLADHFTASQS